MEDKKIKLCIFDLAGTLVQDKNYVRKIFIQAFKKYDIVVTAEVVDRWMGFEKKLAIDSILNEINVKGRKKLVTTIHHTFTHMMNEYYSHHLKSIAYAEATLKKLKAKGLKLAVNTGFGKETLHLILESLGWYGYFDAYISSDQVVAGRPHPYMINYIKKTAKISDPSQIAKIGDTPSDLLEGQRSKCGLNLGICSRNFPLEEMKKYPHTHLVNNLREAADIILAHTA